jgi:ADP-dependent NAD(P)H-hydrate dehydratase / NAD(P)H-hydrate epimerase
MIAILSPNQIREADQFTITHEPIPSIDLMERASAAFVSRFCSFISDGLPIKIFCGLGNNGGDGLAIARMLIDRKYKVHVFIIGDADVGTLDFQINLSRLQWFKDLFFIKTAYDLPLLNQHEVIIDAIFGTGLSRPIEGLHGQVIQHINHSGCEVIAVDIASGLLAQSHVVGKNIIKPSKTITFQLPKLAFFQPSLSKYVGDWYIENIKLDLDFIKDQKTFYHLLESADVARILKVRYKFMHKGEVGKLQLVAGSRGKMGAAILSARAAMRTGVGLLTINSPVCGIDILQTSIPEAMVEPSELLNFISGEIAIKSNHVVAMGPGIGTNGATVATLASILGNAQSPLVLDADALNILSSDKELISQVPHQSILTPHPIEFERLVGTWSNDYEKLELLRNFCIKYSLNVVLKGANSAICDSDGVVCFNPTGNPGMATAGSGDVLTGIVGSLLSQGYLPKDALRLGVYLHGLAGDLAIQKYGVISLIASDIIEFIPQAIVQLSNEKLRL